MYTTEFIYSKRTLASLAKKVIERMNVLEYISPCVLFYYINTCFDVVFDEIVYQTYHIQKETK